MSTTAKHRSIVVGVDGTPGSLAALEFAFVEAIDRGAPVVVVTTWMQDFPIPFGGDAHGFGDQAVEARKMQDAAIRGVVIELGEVPAYSQLVVNDVSGPALVDAARTAALLVVGTGRKDPLSRAFLGSVSEFCARHSPVPLVVVPVPVVSSPFAAPDRSQDAATLRS
jgi:nucleotide-binding universal stress UspA family protein